METIVKFTRQLFSDLSGNQPLGDREDSGYERLRDAKMGSREWFNSQVLMSKSGGVGPKPQSFKVFDRQGGVVLHQTSMASPCRAEVLKWRTEYDAR